MRFRRADLKGRQQIKWFVYGAAMMVVIVVAGDFIASQLYSDSPSLAKPLGDFTFALGILALPLGVGVGMLRYRLYDIASSSSARWSMAC